MAQRYSQDEGIDFEETFARVARLESIGFLLGMACIMNFKLFQMDVKSAFLNGFLQEELFVEKPKGFEDSIKTYHVYKLNKALYGLKQALLEHSMKDTLVFWLEKGYTRESVDKTLFILNQEKEIMLAQIYLYDIVFGSTSQGLVDKFMKNMT